MNIWPVLTKSRRIGQSPTSQIKRYRFEKRWPLPSCLHPPLSLNKNLKPWAQLSSIHGTIGMREKPRESSTHWLWRHRGNGPTLGSLTFRFILWKEIKQLQKNTTLFELSKLLLSLEHSVGHWEQSSEPNSHGPAFVKFKPLLRTEFSSVPQSCPTLCDPMNRSKPGLPVDHKLPEFTQTHVHRVSNAIQPSHPPSSPTSPTPNPSQQKSFQWVNSSHEVAKVLEFQL